MIGVVRFEGDPISEELLGEVFGLELIPFIGRRPSKLVLLVPLLFELFTLLKSPVIQDALVRIYAKLFAVWSRDKLIFLDESLELFLSFIIVFLL